MENENKKIELIGKDELNLVEVPFTLLSNRLKKEQKILKFIDKQNGIIRHWKIVGSEEYGLPCALDESVYIAMLTLTKRDKFSDLKVYFNQYEILKLMRWPIDGKHYDRLDLALCKLTGVTIYTDYLWDNGKFIAHIKKIGFHIIDEFAIDKGKKNIKNSYFKWSDRLFNSFLNGNIKNLDLEIYFGLKTSISRRFYRLCDKRLWKKSQSSFDLQELVHEKLGMSRNITHPSLMKQKLKPVIEEHKEKKLLSATKYKKGRNKKWMLVVKKQGNKKITEEHEKKTEDNPVLVRLLSLDIPQKKAESLIEKYNTDIIDPWINALSAIKPENPSGFLIQALEEGWTLPKKFKKKLAAKEKEKEEKLKQEYNRFLISQVDEYLKKCNQALIEEELREYKKIFMEKNDFDEMALQNPEWMLHIEYDYKRQKAKSLDLISFEEWKQEWKQDYKKAKNKG